MSNNIKVISFLLIVFCLIGQVLCISQKTEQQAVNWTENLMKNDSADNLINWTYQFNESPIETIASGVFSGFSGYLGTNLGKIHAVCGVILTGIIHVLCA